jgi:uncharacterized protein (TIGR02145 family)
MKSLKFTWTLILSSLVISLHSCKTEEIILHGEISGTVTDAQTSQPLQSATVRINPAEDSTNTGSDGKYLLKGLTPGEYEIQASKNSYAVSKQSVVVASAETKQADFSLDGIPVPNPSVTFLDFGLDSTSLSFAISNSGKGKFSYLLIPSKDWITISPSNGDITNETDNIIVNINKTGLSESIYQETIKVISFEGQTPLSEIMIPVYMNGVRDHDGNYYKVVRIGTQIWMAENLNVGIMIGGGLEQNDFQIIKKYCYINNDFNCKIYGGLYTWPEMMQGAKPDSGNIGTIRGICPVGWHIPTTKEWNSLINYLDESVAGVKLKEAGTTHWESGNVATNESGFTALPGGIWDGYGFDLITTHEYLWTASIDQKSGYNYAAQLSYLDEKVFFPEFQENQAAAVRCIMDPPKK